MVLEFKFGKTARNIKVNGFKEKRKAKESLLMQTEIYIMDNFKMIKRMESAHIYILMDLNMLAVGHMICQMARVFKNY
jgi:hypothetical protein